MPIRLVSREEWWALPWWKRLLSWSVAFALATKGLGPGLPPLWKRKRSRALVVKD